MTDGLRPYPGYKDSGVPWLGEVPEHWELKPLKRWVRINAAVLPETTPPEREFRYLDIGSVGTGNLTAGPQKLYFGAAPTRARRIVCKGDTIVSTVRTYLKAVYFVAEDADDLVCSTGFAVLTPPLQAVPKFLSYLAQSSPFADRVTADSVGVAYPAIAESRLGSFHVSIPPFTEQSAIVRFLNHADRRIRRYIRAKQKLIKLLEEQKQAIIHRAVTRGLDPNVRLKPSGVEWLGEVPEHWEVVPLRRRWTVTDCKHLTVPFVQDEDGTPLASVREVQSFDLSLAKAKRTTQKWYEALIQGDRAPRRGDLIYCRNVSVGAAAFVNTDERLAMGQDVCLIRSKTQNQRYLNYFLHSPAMERQLSALMVGSTFDRINVADIKGLTIPVPPKTEQDAIAAELDRQMVGLDRAVSSAQHEVSLLREYRTRLIADVVTGKLDVREAAARLPDEEVVEEGAEVEEAEGEEGEMDTEEEVADG